MHNLRSLPCFLAFPLLSNPQLGFLVGAAVSFGVGAGLIALGVTSPIAITILTLIANAIVMQLVSKITERSSSPPIQPSGLVDSGVKVNGASAVCVPSSIH